MIARVGKAARALLGWWLQSWLFLIWSAMCVSIGATMAFVTMIATLKAQGIL